MTSYVRRALEDRWLEASCQFPVLLLTGPRQAGKTTLLEHLCAPDRRYVTFDDIGMRQLAREDPRLFLERFPPPLLLDEIQYAPELLPEIKIAVDADTTPGAYWLTGSQQFHMMKGVTESLAGRVAIISLLGFSNREHEKRELRLQPFIPAREDLADRSRSAGPSSLDPVYQRIFGGSSPALATGVVSDRGLFYSSYLQTYLYRDVRDLAQVGDLERFGRFVRACAARTAQLLNVADLARDTDISPGTAKNWLSILTASFQIFLLQPFHSNLTKRLYKRPKLYFLDTGLCAYLTEWSSPATLAAGAMGSAIFETHVVAEILKSWWHRAQRPSIYFYRDKDGTEIDLLLERDGRLHPVEIKRASTPRRDWVAPFATLSRFPLETGEGGVVTLGDEPVPLDAHNTTIPVGWI